jgi:histone-lysine N-methyltransferase EZH2
LRKGQKLVCFEDDRCACYGLNRECDPDLCGACGVCDVLDPLHRHENAILTDRCSNANIQRGITKRTLLGTSGVHGFGLYAGEKIHEHDFVGEYRGEIITKSESARRGAVYEHQKLSYVFSLNKTQDIDSTYFGNKVRFINHANPRSANLYPRIMIVNLIHRIGLFGSRTTKVGEELLFNYGPEFPEDQLGGAKSTSKEMIEEGNKSAPRVRNSELTRKFYDVVFEEDDQGNRRAVKMAKDGRPQGNGIAAKARGRSTSMQAEATPSRKKARGGKAKRLIDDDEDELMHPGDDGHDQRGASSRHMEVDRYSVQDISHLMDVDDESSVEDDDFHPDEGSDSVSGITDDDT